MWSPPPLPSPTYSSSGYLHSHNDNDVSTAQWSPTGGLQCSFHLFNLFVGFFVLYFNSDVDQEKKKQVVLLWLPRYNHANWNRFQRSRQLQVHSVVNVQSALWGHYEYISGCLWGHWGCSYIITLKERWDSQ